MDELQACRMCRRLQARWGAGFTVKTKSETDMTLYKTAKITGASRPCFMIPSFGKVVGVADIYVWNQIEAIMRNPVY